MAKYTDPNTGVKYSTHTGLKVFTVIVVILLVISVVLNVVLYMQDSDDSVIDSGENGESGDDGVFNGDSSEDDTHIEPGEGIVDTETVIEKELSNGYAVRTSEFREHGAATCLYYYPDENWIGENGDFYGCSYCDGPCEGHEGWITKSGAVYNNWSRYNEPDVRTQALVSEDGSTDINSKIRVSLVFVGYPEEVNGFSDYVEYTDYYYNDLPSYIEITSLTAEPLEIESVEMRQYVYYVNTGSGFSPAYTEYHSEKGIEIDLKDDSVFDTVMTPDVTTVYRPSDGNFGWYTFTLTLSDGNSYSFEYWSISNADKMLNPKAVEYIE